MLQSIEYPADHLGVIITVTGINERGKMTDDTSPNFTLMGIAAMLPGMQLALDLLSRQIEDYRAVLRALQMTDGGATMPKRRGRPPKKAIAAVPAVLAPVAAAGRRKSSEGIKAYWAKMTPKQRAAEMKRRVANGLGRRKAAAA